MHNKCFDFRLVIFFCTFYCYEGGTVQVLCASAAVQLVYLCTACLVVFPADLIIPDIQMFIFGNH